MSDLLEIKGVGPKTREKLFSLNIFNIQDLIDFLPSGYLDFDEVGDISQSESGAYAVGKLNVVSLSKPFKKGKLSIFKAICRDDNGLVVEVTWYNANYVFSSLNLGDEILCYGKIIKDKLIRFTNPIFKKLKDNSECNEFSGLRPIYSTRGMITQGNFLNIIKEALAIFDNLSIISQENESKFGILSYKKAVHNSHFPPERSIIEEARERVLIEKNVRKICAFKLVGKEYPRGHIYLEDPYFLKAALKFVPFSLTESQICAVKGIIDKLVHSKNPLNSILIGDVGSGKTVVALLAAYFAVNSGHQVALIAPTEVLAKQHYNTFSNILKDTGIIISFVSGSLSKEEKYDISLDISEGITDIAIGTHSLLSKDVEFKSLSMVIMDEQHRFGVEQRTAFISKGIACDLLSLSATPIPRSYEMMLLGNVDIVFIEKLKEIDNVKTAVVLPEKRDDMFEYIVTQCEKGAQAFIVAPRIFDIDGIECDSVESLKLELQKKYEKRVSILTIHGKLASMEKDRILSSFKNREGDILLSTSLIEVGIDIPNASIMVIMNADRFGLASLHQLRGRIGRAGQPSFCFLYSDKFASFERLQILIEERDGIKIAERDYEIRGPGELLGESQSGYIGTDIISKKTFMLCSEIASNIDINKNYSLLFECARKFGLERVSFN